MAKNDNKPQNAAAVAAAPAPGIFDELAKFEQATAPASDQRHTFGAWCRAKGVKLPQVREAIKAGRLPGTLTGDGPEMSEAEFDEAVDFKYVNTFGEIPGQKIHVPAELARQGGTSRDVQPGAGGEGGEGGGGGATAGGNREV